MIDADTVVRTALGLLAAWTAVVAVHALVMAADPRHDPAPPEPIHHDEHH